MLRLIGALLLSAATAFAADSVFEKPLLYPVTGDPIVKRDVVYGTDGDAHLLADIYLPRTGTGRPIAIFIHGGPIDRDMQPKNWRVYRDYGRLLAANGFVAVTFNHRLFEMGKYETSSADVDALFDYVRAHAAELGADPDRVVVWLFSGGGPLLPVAARKPYVRALIDFYAFLNNVSAADVHVPMLIVRGGRDDGDLNAKLQEFLTDALARGVTVELLNHPNGVHAFDILTDEPRTRAVIRRAVEFARTYCFDAPGS